MPNLISRFNYGSEIKNLNNTLYIQLSESYTETANIVNTKTSRNVTNVDPPANSQVNMTYQEGDVWINSSTNNAWMMTSRQSNTAVTWTKIT